MKGGQILPEITRKGQPYYDERVMTYPKPIDELEYAVGRCFNSAETMAKRKRKPIQVAWQKVRLNWK